MIDVEHRIHVYEQPGAGKVYFRVSGNQGWPMVECAVITTRAYRNPNDSVVFIEPATGHSKYTFPDWFKDWADEDNYNPSDNQAGRSVMIAVVQWALDEALASGNFIVRQGGFSSRQRVAYILKTGMTYDYMTEGDIIEAPIAAVLIDDRWVFPLPDQSDPTRKVDLFHFNFPPEP